MKYLLLFLAFFSSAVFAENKSLVSFHLDHIPIIELAQLVYADVSKSNFVVDSSVLDLKNNVTVHFSDMESKRAVGVLESLLKTSGVEITKVDDVVYLRALKDIEKPEKKEIEEEIFFYRPRFRSVAYIEDLCAALFKKSRFANQRKVSTPAVAVPASSPVTTGVAANSQSVTKKPVDSGNSAYSQISKDPDAFFFIGVASDVDKLKKLLVQIDVAIPQVFVKGMVFEVTTGSKEGSAFGLAVNILQGKFGISVGSVSAVGDSISFKSSSIDAVFSALNSDSHFKSVSNPSLRVQSGASARFSVGSDVPVLGAIQTQSNGSTVQAVDYKPSGVIFDLQPTIRDDSIDLTIHQQLSSFILTTTGVNNSPTLLKREINTSIGASHDDVIVLGGLDEDKTSSDSSGFSMLPDWLKSKGGDTSKTQILLVLQVQKI